MTTPGNEEADSEPAIPNPTIKDWLLAPHPRFENGIELPDRPKGRVVMRDLDLE